MLIVLTFVVDWLLVVLRSFAACAVCELQFLFLDVKHCWACYLWNTCSSCSWAN